ncbi:hypothetical protein F3Y22_tig00110733pilonHSYRG00072 [Hibiscus syriacus]|uniref:Uncharacterized protein n=1 Tax=Hibiscus syriacus TaxID=106335 RepID=A0A6A2ZUM8_HIBSY|nr:hypothetical protein F3Y22_tig00110733pilonHSYRG00072 [Hibiscus syriacus]
MLSSLFVSNSLTGYSISPPSTPRVRLWPTLAAPPPPPPPQRLSTQSNKKLRRRAVILAVQEWQPARRCFQVIRGGVGRPISAGKCVDSLHLGTELEVELISVFFNTNGKKKDQRAAGFAGEIGAVE